MHEPSDLTLVLHDVSNFVPGSKDRLIELVYSQLRKMAQSQLMRERADHTLQATALVHEAYMRLMGGVQGDCVELADKMEWQSRSHFFFAAAEAMRRILIENARRKARLKHGGGMQRLDASILEFAGTKNAKNDDEMLAVHEALDSLAVEDPIKAELVKLRYFVGLEEQQAADLLGISRTTAHRYWVYSKAWLFDRLRSEREDS
jgi:RNA polymerase sigma factor (TIGR02999 family)